MKKLVAIVGGVVVLLVGTARWTVIAAAGQPQWVEVYKTDFAEKPGPQWSTSEINAVADKKRVLGLFDNTPVTLSLEKLPPHRWVRVNCELYITDSWDGSPGDWGPDIWCLAVEGGPSLIRTSFDHAKPRKQADPDDVPLFLHAAGTGAVKEIEPDSASGYRGIYRVEAVFPHTATALKLVFKGQDLEGVDSEGWGLGGVAVAVADAPTLTDTSQANLEKLWKALGSTKADEAHQALWQLVGGGEATVKFLQPQVKTKMLDIAELVKQLDDNSFQRRQAAQEALVKLGPDVEPAVIAALAKANSPEVRSRLQIVLDTVRAKLLESQDSEGIRRVRAQRVLSILSAPASP